MFQKEKEKLAEALRLVGSISFSCSTQNSESLRPWQPRNEKLWYKKIQI